MYKNINVVYDDMDEIFYNNKYLDILKEKNYVFKMDSEKIDIEFKIIDNNDIKHKSEITNKEKYLDVLNQIKIVGLANIKKDFWKFKYLEKKLCYEQCITCSYRCLSYNYIIKKYIKQKINDSNILVITDIPGNWSYYTIEEQNMIFEKYAYYLYNNLTNSNIYMILCGKNMKTYKNKIINNKNNNTFHLLTHDTDGNILNKKTFDTVLKNIDDIKYDYVFINSINKYDYIKLFMVYLYIILYASKHNTVLLSNFFEFDNIIFNKISLLLNNHFSDIKVVRPKLEVYYTSILYIYCSHFRNNVDKLKILINNILDNKSIDILYSNDNKIIVKLNKFIDDIYDNIYIYNRILLSIIDKKYEKPDLYNIIKHTIKIKQIICAEKKKYKKYLLPY